MNSYWVVFVLIFGKLNFFKKTSKNKNKTKAPQRTQNKNIEDLVGWLGFMAYQPL